MADPYAGNLLEGFFQSDFFAGMVNDHMLFGFVGYDGIVTDQARQDMHDTIGRYSHEDRAGYLRERVEEMFCLSAEDFGNAVERYNASNSSSVVPDLPTDLLAQVHAVGSQQNQEACAFLADHGQDTSPVLDSNAGMKP